MMGIIPENLVLLINRYEIERQETEKKLKEIESKLFALKQTKELLEEEAPSIEQKAKIIPLSTKYSKMSKRKAILDILKSNIQKEWSGKAIKQALQIGGYITRSRNLQRDVYITLYRLATDKEIIKTTSESERRFVYKAKEEGSTFSA